MFQVAFAVDHVFQRNTSASALVVHVELFLFFLLFWIAALVELRRFLQCQIWVIELGAVARKNWLFVIFLEIGDPYCSGFPAITVADVFSIESEPSLLYELFHLLFILHVKHINLVLAMRLGIPYLICVINDSLFILCQVIVLFKFSLVLKDGEIGFPFCLFILFFIIVIVLFSICAFLITFFLCLLFLSLELVFNLLVGRHNGCNFDDFAFICHEV